MNSIFCSLRLNSKVTTLIYSLINMKTYCVLRAVPGPGDALEVPWGAGHTQLSPQDAGSCLGARPLSRQPEVEGEDSGGFPECLYPWPPKSIALSCGLPKTAVPSLTGIVSQVCLFWLVSSWKVGALLLCLQAFIAQFMKHGGCPLNAV